jgi:hypothetical protein
MEKTNLKLHDALLDQLEAEGLKIQELMKQLLAEMENVPPEKRTGGAWGPAGSYTKRFMELMRRQRELAEKLQLAMVEFEQPTLGQN